MPHISINSSRLIAIFIILALAALCFPSCFTPAPAPPPGTIQAYVGRVVDGDTIVVNIHGCDYKVRYIGMDTPEIEGSGRPPAYFGQEASRKNRELVEGRTVALEKDVSETDRYGRLLRYVWVDGVMVNAELVRLGYAHAITYPPDVKYQDVFRRLEKEARENKLGFWAAKTSG